MSDPVYPPEVVATLGDLLRLEGVSAARRLLPDRPVYSLLAGRHSSKLRGRGLDFEEVRQYVGGDDIRNIDWRVTARTGRTHSKVFNEERERPVFIVLDQSSRMFFGSQKYTKSVIAAHAAAISAFYTLKRGDRVGGIVFGDNGNDYVSPRRNRDSLLYFLQAIAKWNGLLPGRKEVGRAPMDEILRTTALLTPHDYVITLIGDWSGLTAEQRQSIKAMGNHNDVILAHIYDAFETGLPDGRLLFTDGRDQILWSNNRGGTGEAWRKGFEELKRDLSVEFRGTRIPVVFLNTIESVDKQLKQELWTRSTTS